VLDETLNRIAETEDYHEYAPEFGERAWRVKGRFADIITGVWRKSRMGP